MGKITKELSPEVEEMFNAYPWYGNVRELRNVIERVVIFCKGHTIDKDLLPHEMITSQKEKTGGLPGREEWLNGQPIDAMLSKVEKDIIEEALRQTKGNKSRAAEILGISRYSLTRRIDKLCKEEKPGV